MKIVKVTWWLRSLHFFYVVTLVSFAHEDMSLGRRGVV